MAYQDILYDKRDGIATVTINRPTVLNAFRAKTVEEMLEAVRDADHDDDIGVIVLAGAGDRAFSAGGDNSSRDGGYAASAARPGRHADRGTAQRDPRRAKAGHRQGPGLCDRRRQRAGHGMRFDDCLRKSRVRPGWAARRLGRSGLSFFGAHGLPVAPRRREAGARNLVSVPALHGRRSVPDGPRQQGRAGRGPRCRGREELVPREILALSPTAIKRSPSARSTPTARTFAGSARSASRRWRFYLWHRRGEGGHRSLFGEAAA